MKIDIPQDIEEFYIGITTVNSYIEEIWME